MIADLAALERALAKTALLLRLQRALDAGASMLAVSASAGALRLLLADPPRPALVLACVGGCTLAGAALAACRPVQAERVGSALDRAGSLSGRVRAAVAFRREPPAQQTAFMRAALRDAARHLEATSAWRAAPLRAPRTSWLALLALGACALAGLRPARSPAHVRAPSVPVAQPLLREPDELASPAELRRWADDETLSLAVREQLASYRALLARIRTGELSTAQAVASALALERMLASKAPSDTGAQLATRRMLAAELRRAQPALARALTEDLTDAAGALDALAERVREQKLAPQEREQLALALARAREREQAQAELRAQEQQAESRLLHAQKQAERSDEPSLLQRADDARRKLEALRRNQVGKPSRELDELSRELARAGDALAEGDAEQAAESLDQASSAARAQQQRARGEARQAELARAVAQLRELLQRRQLARERAAEAERGAGQASGKDAAPQQGPGTSPEARAQRFRERAQGESADGGSHTMALSDRAGGSEGAPSASLMLPGSTAQPVQVVKLQSTSESHEHDPTKLAQPSTPGVRPDYQDSALVAAPGAGPTRSQVIQSAAGAGFASARYRKVYGDYRAHAEAVLERDRVPPGARFQVRRYFELVRPREGLEPHE